MKQIKANEMNNFVGIDFGSSGCCVAYREDSIYRVIEKDRLPGYTIKTRNGLSDLKHMLNLQRPMNFNHSAVEFSQILLKYFADVRLQIRHTTGQEADNAVITLPAIYSDKQRAALKAAAEQAGFKTVKLLNDSKAALIDADIQDDKPILVYSLGAGVFSVSIYRFSGGLPEDIIHEGKLGTGGGNFNWKMLVDICARLNLSHRIHDPSFLKIMIPFVESIKIALSSKPEETRFLPDMADTKVTYSRKEFEQAVYADIEETIQITEKAISGARLTTAEIGCVILVGGSTKIPLVQRMLKERIGNNLILLDENSTARGAAKFGQKISPAAPQPQQGNEPREDAAPKPPESDSAEDPTHISPGWLSDSTAWLNEAEQLWNNGSKDSAIGKMKEYRRHVDRFISMLYASLAKEAFAGHHYDEALDNYSIAYTYNETDRTLIQEYHRVVHEYAVHLANKGFAPRAKNLLKAATRNTKCRVCEDLLDQLKNSRPAGLRLDKQKRR